MWYYVTFKVEGRYVAAVNAQNVEDAISKAREEHMNEEDFGLLSDIESEPIIVEDENENFVWEK